VKKVLLSIVVVASMLTAFAPAALAFSSIGACSSNVDNVYQSGEATGQTTLYGVFAHIDVPGSTLFGPCSPDDNAGGNASAGQIAIKGEFAYESSFVTMGIIICNTPKSGWPAGLCDGGRHWYGEQHGLAFWDYNLFDFGPASTTDHTYQIQYLTSDHLYHWKIDGVSVGSYDMGAGLSPSLTSQQASWQLETSDPGDGIGDGSTPGSVQITGMEYNTTNSGWIFKLSGSGCDFASSQITCRIDGTYGIYGYTIN
jgi:hypothetical protein